MTKNINYVSHKKSKLKTNDGKPQLPSASALVEGEIAINYAEDVETLSIKNESGDVVTFSSDNYYTEQKLGSAFTENNITVTKVIEENERVTSTALNDLNERKLDASEIEDYYDKTQIDNLVGSGFTPSSITEVIESKIDEIEIGTTEPTKESVEVWVDTSEGAIPTAFDVYTKTETNSLLDTKSNIGHKHAISDVNNLQDNLSAKVNKAEYNTYTGTVATQIDGMNNILNDLAKINVIGSVEVDARGYGESTPTLSIYAGSKENLVNDVLSHFKLGWFDGNGNLVKECAPGRISSDKEGNDIPIDGTLKVDDKSCDLLLYTDAEIYRDRLTTSDITLNGSTASTFNVFGLGLAYHAVGNVSAKRFEPFAFTPHCAKYADNKAYSYYDGENVQTSINSLTSSIRALNKGGGYMGLYYEFYEIWLMAMYLELGTLDFTNEELFGRGCTNGTPNINNWYSTTLEGGGGSMKSDNSFLPFWSETVTSYNFSEMLEAQRIMDGIVKAGFATQIGGNKLYTYDNSGNVVSVTGDTNPSYWEKSSGMTEGKKYFTVKNVKGCKGLADGVMTGIVNIYVKDTDRIRKYSHPVYRGLDLLSGFFTQLEGLHYVVRQTAATTGQNAPYQELYYANTWKDVPTDTSLYTGANAVVTGQSDEDVIDKVPLLLANYERNGEFNTQSDGWIRQTDYSISLYAHKLNGASQHTYECGYIWWRGTSYGSTIPTNSSGQLTAIGKSANASVVGCDANYGDAGRTLSANSSVSGSAGNYAGGFAHPQITV